MTNAAKHFDPVLGVDVHIIQPPGPVPPVPVPHPYTGMVFDPFDYAPWIGATVKVGGVYRAQAGTATTSIPYHIPIGGTFIKPPANEGEMFMGSSTVCVDGDAFSHLGLPVLTCQDVGIPGPPRAKGSPPRSLVLPTTVVLSIPLPVLIGGPPTISLMALGFRLGIAALARGLRRLRRVMQASARMRRLSRALQRRARRLMNRLGIPPSVRNRVHRAICRVTGHPVDVATGKVFTEAADVRSGGPLLFFFDRVWFSTSTYSGELGHGWHHTLDMTLWLDRHVALLRMDDGRHAAFALPGDDAPSWNGLEHLLLHRTERGYVASDERGVHFEFTPSRTQAGGAAGVERWDLTCISDRCGNTIEIDRTYRGGVRAVVDSTGRTFRFQHDTSNRIVGIWGPHPDRQDEEVLLVRYVYDAAGDLRKVHDAVGAVQSYDYRNHLLVQEVERGGLTYRFAWDGCSPDARCTRTWGTGGLYDRRLEYDVDAGVTVVTNGDGHPTTYRWNSLGLVEQTENALGFTEHDDYDEDGDLLTHTYEDGSSLRYEYDVFKRISAIAEPGGLTTRYEYDAFGGMTLVEHADGTQTKRAYDGRGLLVSETFADTTTWTIHRNARGLRVREVSSGGAELSYEWSPGGEMIATVDADGGRRAFGLDRLGRTRREIAPDGTVYRCDYDLVGNLTFAASSHGLTELFTWDEGRRLVAHTDPLGRTHRYEYGPQGLCTRAVAPDGTATSYTYDREANLTGVLDATGGRYSMTYDAVGRVVAQTDFSGRRVEQTRDALGRATRVVDARGRATTYDYDARGRLCETRRPSGDVTTLSYDAMHRVVAATSRRASVRRTFAPGGRLVAESCNGLEVRFEYDAAGNRAARTSPTGHRIEYAHHAGGRLQRVSDDNGVIAALSYDAGGREVLRDLRGGSRRRCSYHPHGRLARCELTNQDGKAIHAVDCTYDRTGTVLTALRDSSFGTTLYQHDRGSRLVGTVNADGEQQAYERDIAGHLRGAPVRERDALHGEVALRWDEDGNLVERLGEGKRLLMSYDDDRLSRIVVESDEAPRREIDFEYDAFQRRVLKRVVTPSTGEVTEVRYVWDRQTLMSEFIRAGTVDAAELVAIESREYLVSPTNHAPLALFDARRLLHVQCDQNATPRAAIDEAGQVQWAADVAGYGHTRRVHGESPRTVPFRFPGQYADEETGLYYNYFRYYDPTTGLYNRVDPLGLRAGRHLWNYVSAPADWVDVFGLAHHSDSGHYVYGLYDSPYPPHPNAQPYYVGITDDPSRRLGEHQDVGRARSRSRMYNMEASTPTRMGAGHGNGGPTVNYGQARGYEQAYIEHHGTRTGSPGASYRGGNRGNRRAGFDVNNSTRPRARHDAFCDARRNKLNQLGTPCG